jgi:hypothetical protein
VNVHHFPTEQLETAGSIYYPPGRLALILFASKSPMAEVKIASYTE